MRYAQRYTHAEAVDGFAWISGDSRKMARVHAGAGDVNAAKRTKGFARRLGKLSKNAEGQARREAKVERREVERERYDSF